MTARRLFLSRRAWAVGLIILLPIGIVLGALFQQNDSGPSACVSHWNASGSAPREVYGGGGGTYRALILTNESSCTVWVRAAGKTTSWEALASGSDIGQGAPLGNWTRGAAPPPKGQKWTAAVSGETGELTAGSG